MESFISALFNEDKRVNQDNEELLVSYKKELLHKKNTFVSEFERILEFEGKLEKLMKIEKSYEWLH